MKTQKPGEGYGESLVGYGEGLVQMYGEGLCVLWLDGLYVFWQ